MATPNFMNSSFHSPIHAKTSQLILGLCTSVFLISPSLSQTEEKDSSEAQKNYDVGVADSAKVGTLPDFTTGLAHRAATAFAKGDWKTAEDSYLEIVKESPNNALVLTNLATVQHRLGKLDEALQGLDQALRLNPQVAQAWTLQGLIHYQKGNLNLALSAFARAQHEDPLDPCAHNFLGVVAKDLGWRFAAQQEFRRAIELDPKYGDAHFNLALTYLEQRPPSKELARRHYQQSIQLGSPADELFEERLKNLDQE